MQPAARRGLMSRLKKKPPTGRPGTARLAPAAGRRGKERVLFFLKWGAVAGVALAAVGLSTIALLFWIWGSDPRLPSISNIGDYKPSQVSRVLAADGTVIGEIYTERRTYVPFERMPEHLVAAFVSAEDADFYNHKGIDYVGMLRAFFVNLKAGETRQGASTITQQVVKNFVLTRERTLKRKVQEIILARRLEHALDKNEILTLYGNEIYFGHGRYGVEEAARFYFGKRVEELDIGEAALIAGLPKGPELYSPKKPENQQRAKDRQVYVLGQMVRNGHVTADQARKFIDAPIRIVADPYPRLGAAPEWVDLARSELVAIHGSDGLDKAGVEVTTTLDLETQKTAREALQRALRAYDARQKYGVAVKKVAPKDVDAELARLKKKLSDGPHPGVEYRALVRAVHDDDRELVVDLGGVTAGVLLGLPADRRFNPDDKKPSERFKPGDLVRVMQPRRKVAEPDRAPKHAERRIELSSGPEGAVVVIDPRTRHVLAVVGGYDIDVGDFNRATMAKRQPGSTFKPFVYAAAIDSGEFTAASIVNDSPEVYDLWKPENYEKGEFAGPVRLRAALARSVNTVAIKTAYDIGPERVARLAHAMGIQSTLPTTLSLALGSGEVTPLELTNAFATFATGGTAARSRSVLKIGGERLPPVQGEQVLRPEVAYISLDMMKSVITEGTGGAARVLKQEVAGKTGTSNDTRDAWFVGMSPDLVIGVWIGFDDFERQLGKGESGGKTAIPVFVDLVKTLGKKGGRFTRPPGLVDVRIDKASGLLAPERAPDGTAYTEVFIPGTAPIEVAALPGEVDTGSLIGDQYDELYGGAASGDPPDGADDE
jgi:penicillin-binding protein 1A